MARQIVSAGARPPLTARPPLADLIRLRDDTAEPLYRQLETRLRELIKDGTYAPGATLPAERLLAEALGLSRTTVTKCYTQLREDGLIRSAGRLGCIVEGAPTRLSPGMDRLKGFTEEMREIGRVPSSVVLDAGPRQAQAIAAIFGLPAQETLLKLERVRRGDDIPLSHEVAWYNLVAVPALAGADLGGSIYAQLEAFGTRLVSCEQSVEATMPTPAECAIFGFTRPLPCLLIKRRSYDAAGNLVEYVEGLFRGDSYAYRLRLVV